MKRLSLVFSCALLLSGCFTVGSIVVDEGCDNLVYSGTRASWDARWHGGIVDLPFSFVVDTVLLPYTVPATVIDSCSMEVSVSA